MHSYRLRELKIEINRNCPLHCLHCSSNGMPYAPEQLAPHKICALIREFADLGGERLSISGGEPLCYETLPTIIKSCREANIRTSIYTTGIRSNGGDPKPISDRTVDLLSESGIKIIFSLHGAHAKTHDTLTQVTGSFDTTFIAVNKTVETGAEVEAHVVPTAMNFQELTGITELLASVHIHKVSWLRFVPQGRGLLNREALQLSKEQLRQLYERRLEIQHMYPAMAIRIGAPFNILCPQEPATCEAGLSVLTVRPNGNVAPCDAFKQFRIHDDFGSVLNHSLSEVWHKSYLLNAVRRLHESRLDSSCTSCPLSSKCNSGCLAQKAIVSGKLTDGKDPECPLSDVEIRNGEAKAAVIR